MGDMRELAPHLGPIPSVPFSGRGPVQGHCLISSYTSKFTNHIKMQPHNEELGKLVVGIERRQGDVEGRAFANLTLEPDAPAVQLNQGTGDAQAQSCTRRVRLSRRSSTEETVENPALLLAWDADAIICHAHLDIVWLRGERHANMDVPAERRVLHGVADQIA